MRIRYIAAADTGLSEADAQVLGERIAALGQERELTAEAVVEDARDPRSPTHRYFEWNDETAAHRFRLGQARTYIGGIKFVPAEGGQAKPVAIKVRTVEGGNDAYTTVAAAMQDEDVMLDLIDAIQRELTRLQERYRSYPALRPVLQGPIAEAQTALTRLAMELPVHYAGDEALPRRAVRAA